MIKQNLFIQKEYNVFDKYIDKIFNPMVKKKAMKYYSFFLFYIKNRIMYNKE